MPYIHRRYTHFQLIAYEIPTLHPVSAGAEYRPIKRLPIPDRLKDDERIRLRRLAGVVNFASNRVLFEGSDDKHTLKIFMAPEFYFRPIGVSGSVERFEQDIGPFDSYSRPAALEIIEVLRGMFKDKGFEDWLFIPGTIFWSQPTDPRSPVEHRVVGPRAPVDCFNTATIIKGGAGTKEDTWFHFVHKRQISTIDGAPVENAAVLNQDLTPILASWGERKQNYLPLLDFRRFGIEVCLDHHKELHTLKNVHLEMHKRTQTQIISPDVDLHLLTACGMPINTRSVAAKEGGYILRVDGSPNLGNLEVNSEIVRVTEQNFHGDAKLSWDDASGKRLNQSVWEEHLPADLKLAVSQGDDNSLPQRLVCYQKLPFPKLSIKMPFVVF